MNKKTIIIISGTIVLFLILVLVFTNYNDLSEQILPTETKEEKTADIKEGDFFLYFVEPEELAVLFDKDYLGDDPVSMLKQKEKYVFNSFELVGLVGSAPEGQFLNAQIVNEKGIVTEEAMTMNLGGGEFFIGCCFLTPSEPDLYSLEIFIDDEKTTALNFEVN